MGTDAEAPLIQCARCLLDLSLHAAEGACPNCGEPVPPRAPAVEAAPVVSAASTGAAWLGRFWETLRRVIFSPTRFFSSEAGEIVSEGGLSSALAFAVIVQWLASFVNFLWRSAAGALVESRMSDVFRIAGDVLGPGDGAGSGMGESLDAIRQRAVEFLFGAGTVVIAPFTTLLKLAVGALFVHAAVRFFMREEPGRPHRYATTLKVLAYSTAPWILCVIPGLGMLLAWILAFVTAVIGLREVYRTTTNRAVVAVIFPELLLLALVMVSVAFLLFFAFNVVRLVY